MPTGTYVRKPHSLETRQKISEAHQGMKYPEEFGAKISAAQRGQPKARCVAGCGCEKHRGTQGRSINKKKGYVVLTGLIHPLTGKGELSGNAFEHRVVLWDKLGCQFLDCEHSCHWCGKLLTWATIKADHIDGDGLNNDPENLVPSCNSCNICRGKAGSPADWTPKRSKVNSLVPIETERQLKAVTKHHD